MADRRRPAALYPGLRGARIAVIGRDDGVGHSVALAAHLTRMPAGAGSRAGTPQLQKAPCATSVDSVHANSTRTAVLAVVMFLLAGVTAVILGSPATPGGAAQLWTVLMTGLTTGGLSCLAVQGGLLASSLTSDSTSGTSPPARIIGSFLVAKAIAYAALGAALGLFGSMAQLSVATRGVMQLSIGLFMLVTGIRMLRPYRWLRFVVLEPPPAVRRTIRRVSRSREADSTPIFLGALTVLIPCGVTQAMMAAAIATANPVAGAAVMAVFTLATSPLFFILSYAATSIGRHAQRQFTRIAAVLVIILGYVAIETGAVLLGHPLPIRPLFTNLAPATAVVRAGESTDGVQSVAVNVHIDGYAPNRVTFRAGGPAELHLVTDHITGCTRTISVPALNIQRALEPTGTTVIEIPAQTAGTKLQWVCGMGMFTGTMTFTRG